MADWKDILNNGSTTPLSEEDLLKYLHANTSPQDREQIESIADDSFESEALEGLRSLKDPAQAAIHAASLKQQLKKQLQQRQPKKVRSRKIELQWTIYTIVILLIICVLTYAIIRMFKG